MGGLGKLLPLLPVGWPVVFSVKRRNGLSTSWLISLLPFSLYETFLCLEFYLLVEALNPSSPPLLTDDITTTWLPICVFNSQSSFSQEKRGLFPTHSQSLPCISEVNSRKDHMLEAKEESIARRKLSAMPSGQPCPRLLIGLKMGPAFRLTDILLFLREV